MHMHLKPHFVPLHLNHVAEHFGWDLPFTAVDNVTMARPVVLLSAIPFSPPSFKEMRLC
jgi:hypothetical protein